MSVLEVESAVEADFRESWAKEFEYAWGDPLVLNAQKSLDCSGDHGEAEEVIRRWWARHTAVAVGAGHGWRLPQVTSWHYELAPGVPPGAGGNETVTLVLGVGGYQDTTFKSICTRRFLRYRGGQRFVKLRLEISKVKGGKPYPFYRRTAIGWFKGARLGYVIREDLPMTPLPKEHEATVQSGTGPDISIGHKYPFGEP
jgi:hypothetical protein